MAGRGLTNSLQQGISRLIMRLSREAEGGNYLIIRQCGRQAKPEYVIGQYQ